MLKKSIIIIILILLADQLLKFWIKTNMMLGQEYHIAGNWFIIHFTENNGMAFGWLSDHGFKLALSLLRIVAIGAIGWYLYNLARKSTDFIQVLCVSLIFAGAFGNIIDSAFYGLIFNDSLYQVASFMPEGGGYAGFLHGKVVDMFYFPIIEGHFPEWFPFWAGEEFIFFRPVFNLADASITVGVAMFIIFQKRFFHKETEKISEG